MQRHNLLADKHMTSARTQISDMFVPVLTLLTMPYAHTATHTTAAIVGNTITHMQQEWAWLVIDDEPQHNPCKDKQRL